ncbi:MAG: hypothetical protein QOH97_3991 [Actinoplanes sp.]|nr:hypothetical protein [Actinoplanes sp.]
MRAAVVTSFDKPLEIKEVPTPKPGAGQLLVRIRPGRAATPRSPTTCRSRESTSMPPALVTPPTRS